MSDDKKKDDVIANVMQAPFKLLGAALGCNTYEDLKLSDRDKGDKKENYK